MNVGGTPANLRPPFRPGNAAPRRSSDVDRAIRLIRKHSPDAVRFVARVLHDETADMRSRLKAAEILIERAVPKNPDGLAITVGSDSLEWLELRFVAPGEVSAGSEPHRITFDPGRDIEGDETKNGG